MSSGNSSDRSLSVNAAFLKDIKDDNRELKVLFDKIKPLVSHTQTVVNHWNEIVELLDQLRDQLALHFSLEEAYGYFDAAIDTAPELSASAAFLKSEHGQLFRQIRDLADWSAEASVSKDTDVQNLIASYAKFYRRLQVHEEAELELILQALDDDLGVGD